MSVLREPRFLETKSILVILGQYIVKGLPVSKAKAVSDLQTQRLLKKYETRTTASVLKQGPNFGDFSPKICRLCVCVTINKRSFESFKRLFSLLILEGSI